MRALDLWLLNKLDSLTTKLQRKGYLLTYIYTQVAGLVFVTNTFQAWHAGRYIWLVICGTVWGAWLWGSIRWAEQNKDYPYSAKIMERLNARAVTERESAQFIRFAFIGMSVFLLITDAIGVATGVRPIFEALISSLGWYTVMLMIYLAGCFYIGPGHFAKDKQESVSRDVVHNT